MLTISQAALAIERAMPGFATEAVPVEKASGRVLRQVVRAERDQPPFDRVTMDGIAVRFASLDRGTRQFAIQGTQHAGDPVQELNDDSHCIEIMTGAVLPKSSDCVVPVERVFVAGGTATVENDYEAKARQFIHPRGSDYEAGHELLHPGMRISARDVAILASCGMQKVEVSRTPVIRVVSTGNELVASGKPVAEHQVRLSNGPALVAMLGEHGFSDTTHTHLVDDVAILERDLCRQLDESEVLLLSGGVSMGKADFVPQVLAKLGVRVIFHKISQRPGKPMWFGIGPRQQAVFALPGNPVSSLVCCRQYVLPALLAASGQSPAIRQFAILDEDVTFHADLTCFLPVRLTHPEDGCCRAIPVPTNTSGDFASLSRTDGYVELQKETNDFPAGTVVPLHLWSVGQASRQERFQ